MQITLDEDQWDMSDEATVMEILAQVSDRAHAKHCLVTSLEVGGRPLTDRDLQPLFLARTGREAGAVRARSQTVTDIVADAQTTLEQYGRQLRAEGNQLVPALRAGQGRSAQFDAWLGRISDYVEATEGTFAGTLSNGAGSLVPWLSELLQAISEQDSVRIADLLQYEILTRLPKDRCQAA